MLARGFGAYEKSESFRRRQLDTVQLQECDFEAHATLVLADKDSNTWSRWGRSASCARLAAGR
jgi:hypothetical protein